MYVPPHFAETDTAKLHFVIEQNSFATLISHDGDQTVANHLPLLLDRGPAPCGRLIGHLARANDQWQHADGQCVLAIFHGPHAYISPRWYEEPSVVPTWNYVTVHAYGRLSIIEGEDASLDVLARYVERYESSLPAPWSLSEAGAEFIRKLATQVVCFQVDIDRLEGKFKLSQNHSAQRRQRVVAALQQQAGENEQAIARLMDDLSQSGA